MLMSNLCVERLSIQEKRHHINDNVYQILIRVGLLGRLFFISLILEKIWILRIIR